MLAYSHTVHQSADADVQQLHSGGSCALQRAEESMSYPMVTEMLK